MYARKLTSADTWQLPAPTVKLRGWAESIPIGSRIAFILATVCSVIATIVLTYRVKSGQPNCGDAYQMNNLLACTVGGISFGFGGEGGVLNVIYGILVVGIITNGMTVMGLSSYWQYVMQGTILAFAVGMDYVQRRRSKA